MSRSPICPRMRFSLFDIRTQQVLAVISLSLLLGSCGGGGTSNPPPPPPPQGTVTSVTVTAAGTTVLTGQTLVFSDTVKGTGTYSSAVTWSVNGIPGGNTQTGTINNGTYTAPAALPGTNPITVTATSVADSTKYGTANATVFMIVIAPANPTLLYGQTQQFMATVTGLNSPVVQWSALVGQIDATGLY